MITKTITFTVPGEPIAQPRVKAARRGNRSGVYTPTKTSTGRSNGIAEYKALVRRIASERYADAPFAGPVFVEIDFVFLRPRSLVWKTKPMPRFPHIVRPDVDNAAKAVLDALTGIVWRNDTQVHWLNARKIVAAGDEQPATVVWIRFDAAE